jgi:RNA polymerase sigma-70 factor (ECF subfamily)
MLRTNEPPDSELVAQALAGDREAFGLLYDRFARLVRAVVFRVGTEPQVVNDLAQECFLRAYRNLGRLRCPERFGAWVVGIARQVAREHRRSSRRDRHRYGEAASLAAGFEPDASGSVEDRDEIEHVLRRLETLPELERLAVHAFFLEERDAPRAAGLLGVSRSGLYALLKRALARLAAGASQGARKEA